MNCIPLPDELLRKVYGFIHPAFEYTSYINALLRHAGSEDAMAHIYYNRNNIADVGEKIEYNTVISTYACLMNKYLFIIRKFLKTNPLFIRPNLSLYLTINQYRSMWQYRACISIEQAKRMEKNIHERRRGVGVADLLDKWDRTITLYHDIVYMLKEGSLETIEYNCRVNNIYIVAPEALNEKEYRNHLVRLLIALV